MASIIGRVRTALGLPTEEPGNLKPPHPWLVVVISGVAIGLLRGYIGLFISVWFDLRLSFMVDVGDSPFLVYLVNCLVAVPLALGASALIVFFAPAASGGGIPDIKAALNGIDAPQLFSVPAFVVRCLTIPMSSASGMIIGFEAPMTHMGALVVVLLWERLAGRRPEGRDFTDMVSMGTAMGSCAAFLSPLGGYLMVREELSFHWDSSLSIKTLVGCLISTQISRLMRAFTTCGFSNQDCIGLGGVIRFRSNAAFSIFAADELAAVVIIGIFGGFLGAAISAVTWWRGRLVRKNNTPPTSKVIWAGAAVTVVCACYMLIVGFDTCLPLPDPSLGVFHGMSGLSQSLCQSDGYFNPGALILFEPRYPAVKALFSASLGASEIPTGTLFACVLSVFASMAIVLSMQVPFGLVFPHILMGACLGRLVGLNVGVDPGVCALIGVGAALAGLRRGLLPIIVLVVELTGNVTDLVPVVAAVLIAKGVADALYIRQFDVVIKLKGYPVIGNLSRYSANILERVTVKDVLTRDVIAVGSQDSAHSVRTMLASNNFNSFPVVSTSGYPMGCITRDELMRLCERADTPESLLQFGYLSPAVHVTVDTRFSDAYRIFQKLGYRTLFILDQEGKVAGLLSRTNCLEVVDDPKGFVARLASN